jgi:transketolase
MVVQWRELLEAASLAGHLKLGNLIAIYDDNHVCIDGDINSTFTEDVLKDSKLMAGTQHVEDSSTDLDAISKAIDAAISVKDKPSVIKVTTMIGFGSLLQGTGGVHGSPLKVDYIKRSKKKSVSFQSLSISQMMFKDYTGNMYHGGGLMAGAVCSIRLIRAEAPC